MPPNRNTCRLHMMNKGPPVPNFCAECGSPNMALKIPDQDERLRAVCDDCDAIVYSNPKVVVSCVVLRDDNNDNKLQVLLAERSIEPRKGTWGIPQGFMEHGETTREAAVREVQEETGAMIAADLLRLRAVYNVPGSVQLVYEVRLDETSDALEGLAESTSESSQIGWFDVDAKNGKSDVPVELCFPTVQWALDHCCYPGDDNNIVPRRIQQKTKFYDADTDTWGEIEDEL